MSRRLSPALRAALATIALALGAACPTPRTGAEVRAEFGELTASELAELGPVRAELEVLLDDDSPAIGGVQVEGEDGPQSVLTESPFPMRCSGALCDLSVQLPAGHYRFTMLLYAVDRCGREALLGAFRPGDERGEAQLLPWGFTQLSFDWATFDFDDDEDGIVNVLEVQVCGRTDWDEKDQSAARCAKPDHPCCRSAPAGEGDRPWGSPLIGRMTRFQGSYPRFEPPHALRDVGPFWLDATEVTWGQLSRCVAAGACFDGQPQHPVRRALLTADRREPATGLSPLEAQTYCRWAGKRLPYDQEWDFAAAAREDFTERGVYPFDPGALPHLVDGVDEGSTTEPGPLPDDEDLALSCVEGGPRIALNHRSRRDQAEECPLEPVPVGTYPSSHAYRGEGPPVADLAGNVWEWTLPNETQTANPFTGPAGALFPAGVEHVYIRGGNHRSAPLFLTNDFNRLELDDEDAAGFLRTDSGSVADAVGFRCAADEDDGPPPLEPACSEF